MSIFMVVGLCLGQAGFTPKGLLIYKDPLTGYVEALEYTAIMPVTAYTTRYTLVGGVTRQAQNSGVLADVTFPSHDNMSPTSIPQIKATIDTLDALAQKYPRYAPQICIVFRTAADLSCFRTASEQTACDRQLPHRTAHANPWPPAPLRKCLQRPRRALP